MKNWKENIARPFTSRFMELKGRHALVAFRWIVLGLVLVFTVYGQESTLRDLWSVHGGFRWILLLSFLQVASNLVLALLPDRFFKKGFVVASFLFDIVFVSLAFFWTQGFESDLFMVYFLVLFMTIVARKPSLSFIVAGISCLLYGTLFLKNHPVSELFQSEILVRFSLLWIGALFASLVTREVESEVDDLKHQMQSYWLRSEKMAALGEMASGIAHELNNPLTSILMTLQMMSDRCRTEDSEDLEVIERNAQRCRNVVSGLLKFAQEREFRFEEIDVELPLFDAISLLKGEMKRAGVKVDLRNGSGVEWRVVYASHTHLEQVFFHILRNSIQAMPEGGQVTVGVARSKISNDRHISSDCVDISIEDTGRGLDAERIQEITQPFHMDKDGGRVGFGLAVARGLISKHKGKIWIESAGAGKGAKVMVRLPAALSVEGCKAA